MTAIRIHRLSRVSRNRRLPGLALALGLVALTAGCGLRPFWERDSTPSQAAAPAPPVAADAFVAGRVSDRPEDERRRESQVFKGSDTLSRPPSSRPTSLGPPRDGEVTLNFVDTDVREVVRIVLGDTLGANYLMDPNVSGTITFRSGKPLRTGELLSVLEKILAAKGAALVEADGVLQVVPAEDARKRGVPVRSGRGDLTGQSAVVVPIQYVSAAELKGILEPFKPAGAVVEADPDRNAVIVSGSGGEVQTLVDLVKTFDVDWLSGMSFGLYPLDMTESRAMVDSLQQIFGGDGGGPLAGLVRFVPIERMNAVLVISSRRAYVDKAGEWIKRLDVGDEEVARIFVYYCQNTRAVDLADVLSEIFSPGTGLRDRSRLAPGLASTTLRSARGEGAPTFRTSRDQAANGRLGVTQGDARTPATGTAATTRDAATQSLADRRRSETAFGIGGEGSREIELGTRGEIRVLADDVKNALVVLAKPRDYRLVETALRKLDIVPLQVLIEATILEVQLNDNLRYGVEWFFKYGDSKAAFSRQGTRESPLAPPFGQLARDVVTASLPGFSYFFQSSGVNVVVNALNAVSDVNVVSSPQLFVLDNQTGTLQVGDQVPITTQSSVSTLNPDAPIVNAVEYRDTGVILSVTPRVNASGLVSLDVIQEVSDAVPTTTSDISSPTIQQRRIESTVAVQSGETVALGGLIRDRRIDANEGVPYLSKIPVLGWLFGVTDEAASRTELLVLITPRVVSSADESRRITEDLRQRLRRITPLEQRIR